METPTQTFDLWRLPVVMAKTTFSEPSIYRLMKSGLFPKPVKIGPRAVAWRSDEIIGWLESRERSSIGDSAVFYSNEASTNAA